MDSKGGNPFLMDDYPAAAADNAAASNPFLQDFGEAPAAAPAGADINPFFNFGAESAYQQPPAGDSTNPFASFGVEEASVPEPETGVFITPEAASVPPPATVVPTLASEVDLFCVEPVEPTVVTSPAQPASVVTSPPSKPARPPPPPRPGPPPPPRNTKDLILSVTGAMDETSSQMLDRLQATRTPSPTLMHSPSPTPEHSFADLLDVDSSVPDLVHDAVVTDDDVPQQLPPSQDLQKLDGGGTAVVGEERGAEDMLGLYDAPPVQPATVIDSAASSRKSSFATADATAIGLAVQKNASPPAPPPRGEVTPPKTSQLADNPFSDAGQMAQQQQYRGSFDHQQPQQKRPSISVNSPLAAQMESVDTSISLNEPMTTTTTTAINNNVFGDVTSSAPPIDASSFFSTATAAPPTTPSGGAFGDLLGDLSSSAPATQTAVNYTSASPAPTTEFPSSVYGSTASNASFVTTAHQPAAETNDAFDAFASKFDRAGEHDASSTGDPFYDPFTGGGGGGGGGSGGQTAMDTSSDVWGDSTGVSGGESATGFDDDTDGGFDSFLSMTAPPPDLAVSRRRGSADSDEAPDFSVVIKPREGDQMAYQDGGPVPVLAPPPKSPMSTAYADSTPRFNPFDKTAEFAQDALAAEGAFPELKRTDSQETPPTPLFDEDVSQPLEDFPRVPYVGDGWEMQLRFPIKKKITGQRFWKKVWVKLVFQGDNPVVQLYNAKGDKDPFQELPLLACYSVSEIAAQQFDQYGKIFTVKLQYITYKERPGVRPGQVTKAERITNKLSQFAAYAIQGDYQGVKEFGSDLKKLGLPVEHAPTSAQLFKFGSQTYEDMKTFSVAIEEALFKLSAHRDRALQYKMEEVQISVVDEVYVEQNVDGHVDKQIARVRLFFLGFLSGMPDVELGINDIYRQGKEVVGRHDIIPVPTEEWIRLENLEFHSCVQNEDYEKTRVIKFKPPDACYIELMRFRVRPPRNRELPLQLKAVMCVTGNKVELRADILIPGFASRKLGLVPCEDVMVRFPIPECWIYLFRVEKHFRYGSVKSAHRRTGKIKGIERFLGAVDTLDPQLMEVTSGQAKYEHHHHSIVWRMPRLPKEGQGSYTTHNLVCRMNLTSYDQIPEKLTEYAYVEFTMPTTQVSHTMARSVSFQNYDGDDPPEKYVRNLSRHEYRVEIEHTQGEGPGAYISATTLSTPKKTIAESSDEASITETTPHAASDSDSSD